MKVLGVVVAVGDEVTLVKPGDHVIGVAGTGKEIHTRPFQLVTGRVWRGSSFGGVKGRTQLTRMVEDYMNGEIDIDSFITHHLEFKDINEAINLLHKGESIRTILTY